MKKIHMVNIIIKNILENKYVTGIFQENFTLSENLLNKKEKETKNQLIKYSKKITKL